MEISIFLGVDCVKRTTNFILFDPCHIFVLSFPKLVILFQFEKTADHLFEASYHGQRDAINGKDCFIIGLLYTGLKIVITIGLSTVWPHYNTVQDTMEAVIMLE